MLTLLGEKKKGSCKIQIFFASISIFGTFWGFTFCAKWRPHKCSGRWSVRIGVSDMNSLWY